MKMDKPSQLPLRVPSADKRETRSQFAALCYRVVDAKLQVLVVTSRRSKRWILPKGWPENGLTPAQTAAREAYEEAGVEGKTFDVCLGVYSFVKLMPDDALVPFMAMIYPLKVKKTHKKYPEVGQRKRRWVSPKKAAKLVDEPELKRLLLTFDPKRIQR